MTTAIVGPNDFSPPIASTGGQPPSTQAMNLPRSTHPARLCEPLARPRARLHRFFFAVARRSRRVQRIQ
jgi:hypothetical protein